MDSSAPATCDQDGNRTSTRHTRAKCTHSHHNNAVANRKGGLTYHKGPQTLPPCCDQRLFAHKTHFQPAALRCQAYILPMSPMPMMPMLLSEYMMTVSRSRRAQIEAARQQSEESEFRTWLAEESKVEQRAFRLRKSSAAAR